ncbi:MAG TPA: hypothetical protein VFD42_07095 [Chloroflexota bacterium]|nr:hypothetical protein [Chloroflexota bacterium]
MRLILVVATITGLLMGGPHFLTSADAAVPVPFDIQDPGQIARGLAHFPPLRSRRPPVGAARVAASTILTG